MTYKTQEEKQDFYNSQLDEARELIESVIVGKVDKVVLPRVLLKDLRGTLMGFGCSSFENFDTNGWQIDFWLNIDIQGASYCLEGDLWGYKDFTFSIDGE